MVGECVIVGLLAFSACTSAPDLPTVKTYSFPKGEAFVGVPKRGRFERLGLVRTKVDFQTLDAVHDEDSLCRNYYNKAVTDLVKRARDNHGQAVIEVQSVVFLEDGRVEKYKTPECSDEGMEGQILTEGTAIRWLPDAKDYPENPPKSDKDSVPTQSPRPESGKKLEKNPVVDETG